MSDFNKYLNKVNKKPIQESWADQPEDYYRSDEGETSETIITVKDVIKYLQQFNPNMPVELEHIGWDNIIERDASKERKISAVIQKYDKHLMIMN